METGISGHNEKAYTSNAASTRNTYRIDTTGKGIHRTRKSTTVTDLGGMKNNFRTGYIIVPFDVMAESGHDIIKEYGKFTITTEAFRYYAKNTYQTASAGGTSWISTEAVAYGHTDIETESTGAIEKITDRDIILGEAAFISDIDAFIATCADISSAANANVDYSKLASASERKQVYLNTLTSSVLSDATVASTYKVSSLESISYTTAAGEKMTLGFTAPAAGVYDVSCPISADVTKGVYTRVIKEAADGTKTVLKAETAYNGERHLALITEQLAVGDTVWFEAWANSAATVIDLGIPQMTLLQKPTSESSAVTYAWNNYTQGIRSGDYNTRNVDPVLSVGYFINNFEVDGVEYDYLLKDTYAAGTTIKHDALGLANMAAVDDETTEIDETDATELYNSLKKHEVARGGVLKSTYDRYRLRYSDNAFNKNDTATNGWNVSGVAAQGNREFRLSYGFNLAFGGGNNTIYFDAGVYMQFTAPCDGIVNKITASGNTTGLAGKGVVLHNNKVINASTATTDTFQVLNSSPDNKFAVLWSNIYGQPNTSVRGRVDRVERLPAPAWESRWIKTEIREFDAVGDTVKVVDIMGNETILKAENGKVKIEVSGSPIYVYGIC